ncbi:hypothetical protein ACC677_37460, partial [Rhizobium ruizarguesonis]
FSRVAADPFGRLADIGDVSLQHRLRRRCDENAFGMGAVVRDRESGILTHPDKVHPIRHSGKHFNVTGIHLSEPSPQRTPVLYQAG